MKVIVTGAKGQLGYDVVRELKFRGHCPIGIDFEELDITNEAEVNTFIEGAGAEALIHCAAYTAVDQAEEQLELCGQVNVKGTEYLALACKAQDMKMLYISTDYVFNGEGTAPWKPYDSRQPLNAYGRSKYEGELIVEQLLEKHFIVRISWVFGVKGKNFVRTMLELAKTRDSLNVVADQIGSPTYTADLAVLLADMVESDQYGAYHASNEGFCSWYEFAKEIFRQAGVKLALNPVDSSAFPVKAKRPKNSRMDKACLTESGFMRLPEWQDALGRYLQQLH